MIIVSRRSIEKDTVNELELQSLNQLRSKSMILELNSFNIQDIKEMIMKLVPQNYLIKYPDILLPVNLNELEARTGGLPLKILLVIKELRRALIIDKYISKLYMSFMYKLYKHNYCVTILIFRTEYTNRIRIIFSIFIYIYI